MQAEKSKLRKRLKTDYGGGLQEVCLDQIELFHNVSTSLRKKKILLSMPNKEQGLGE